MTNSQAHRATTEFEYLERIAALEEENKKLQSIKIEAHKMLTRLHDTDDVTKWRGPLAELFK